MFGGENAMKITTFDAIKTPIDMDRFFELYPLPSGYDHKGTVIKMMPDVSYYGFSIVLANPELPPMILDAEGIWQKLEHGEGMGENYGKSKI